MTPHEAAEGAMLVLTTTADDTAARTLSRTLVGEGLAACVSRTSVRSVYRWEAVTTGSPQRAARDLSICEDEEVLLVIKTSSGRVAALERRILELHSYDCPEIVRIAPEHVDAKYLAWLLGACSAG